MLSYFGIFVGIYIVGALLIWFLVNVVRIPRAPWVGLWVIGGAAYLISYIFARRQVRTFSSTEMWWLICLCSLYLVIIELVADFGNRESFRHGRDGPLISGMAFAGVVAFSCTMQLLTLVLALVIAAPRTMRRYVEKLRSRDA
jgi:drug/metabolite transporter (DMT)-like permease